MQTYHFIVKGHVQGVGYRFTAYLNATKLGIKGTVKNLDEDVELFVQGNSNQIEDFKKYLKLGSFMSRVESISEELVEMEKFDSFEIIY
ncbi:MAG: acylphosphatase [Cetobacterium sp.]